MDVDEFGLGHSHEMLQLSTGFPTNKINTTIFEFVCILHCSKPYSRPSFYIWPTSKYVSISMPKVNISIIFFLKKIYVYLAKIS